MRLAGKAGVVTGTSKGLGREILRRLTREGAAIVALSRDADLGAAGVDEVVRRSRGLRASVRTRLRS